MPILKLFFPTDVPRSYPSANLLSAWNKLHKMLTNWYMPNIIKVSMSYNNNKDQQYFFVSIIF